MMLAEKAADLIAGKAPLAPQHAEFYRHGISRWSVRLPALLPLRQRPRHN